MTEVWLGTTWWELLLVLISSVAIYGAVVLVVRLNGLRSLAKMSSFDFAVTVSVGSILASIAATSASLSHGLVALVVVMGCQRLVSELRKRTALERYVDNTPMVLMAGSRFVEENLRRSRISRAELRAKLREANVLDPARVLAVVLETTGDVSVLQGTGPIHRDILDGVADAHLVIGDGS